MRWRLIPALILGLMGMIYLIGGLLMLSITVYFNCSYGPTVVSKVGTEFFEGITLNFRNLAMISAQLSVGCVTLYTSRVWWQKRYRLALILTAILWLCMGLIASQMVPSKTRNRKPNGKIKSQPVAMSVRLG